MRKIITLTVFSTLIALTASAQLIMTPSVEYNTSKQSPAVELGLSVGVESIDNSSTLSIGIAGKRFTSKNSTNFVAGELSSHIFFFKDLGLDIQTSLVHGEFLDKDLTIGKNILNKCGDIIGKEDDTRSSQIRQKLFGSLGVVYRVKNVRLSTGYAFKDYNPDNWTDSSKSPYTGTLKVGVAYVINLISRKPKENTLTYCKDL